MNTRRDNLRKLIEQWSGPTNLAIKLGYANASYLVQMAGPHPTREVSEKTARRIEATLELPEGWMDREQGSAPQVNQPLLEQVIHQAAKQVEQSGVTLTLSKFGDLVLLAYTDAVQHEKPRGDYIAQLIQLAK